MRMFTTICLLLATAAMAIAEPVEGPLTVPGSGPFLEMRRALAGKDGYDPDWNMAVERMAVFDAARERKYLKTVTLAREWLERVPVDIEVLSLVAAYHLKFGEYSNYAKVNFRYWGFVASILGSGDGRGPSSAFKVISVSEEYAVLEAMGLKLQSQVQLEDYDRMECLDRDGKPVVMYFNISVVQSARKRLLEKSKKQASGRP